MFANRVTAVKALPDYKLFLLFRDGKSGIMDMKPYRGYECLANIWAAEVFDKVVVDHGTVMWPGGEDLCPDEIYTTVIGQ